AIDLIASATRREELLLSNDELRAMHSLRREMSGLPPSEAMNTLLGAMKRTGSNEELLRRFFSAA
ncbi:MAG: hypothetical protein P8099_08575, partial [Gemmatimonadota bacterium]